MSRKNIVLLHGWGASVKKLAPLASELDKLGWKVYLPKLPGFDLTPPSSVWGLSEYSKYITEKAGKRFKNKKYYIFGHSFGGRIAINTAVIGASGGESIVPHSAGFKSDNVSGIILCASGGISRGNGLKRMVFYYLAKLGRIFLISPKLAEFWKKLLYKFAREHDYEKADGVMRDVFKKVVSADLKKVVHSIKLPTLILWGEKDRMTPYSDALFLRDNIKKSKLSSYKNEGHKLPYEKPIELAKEINKWIETQENNP